MNVQKGAWLPVAGNALQGCRRGRCRMQGSFFIALWFIEAMKLARS